MNTILGIESNQLYKGTGLGAKVYTDRPPKNEIRQVNNSNYRAIYQSQPILFWGEDNLFPQKLEAAAKKCGIALQGLSRLTEATINQGIFTYKVLEEVGPDQQLVKIVLDKDFDKFNKFNKLHTHYLPQAAYDYWKYGIIFPVYKIDSTGTVLTRLISYRSKDCRLSKRNPDTGDIDYLYVSAQWSNNPKNLIADGDIPDELKGWVFKFDLLDEWQTAERMQAMVKTKRTFDFAQMLKHPSSEYDYGSQPWHSVYFNKWLNIACSVPEMKERLFMYAMTINYMIGVDEDYFETVYGAEFRNWSADKKKEKVIELQKAIEKNVVGKDNSYKSIFFQFRTLTDGSLKRNMILEVIDNKMREGGNLIDNLQANAEIATAMGVNPSLLGTSAMGEKASTGSGSNIREALLDLSSRIRLHRDIILDPLNTVRDFNGWDPDLKFGFKDYILNTQDGRQVDTGKEVIISN